VSTNQSINQSITHSLHGAEFFLRS